MLVSGNIILMTASMVMGELNCLLYCYLLSMFYGPLHDESDLHRSWVEDEARKSQARAKVLEELGRRWRWDGQAR